MGASTAITPASGPVAVTGASGFVGVSHAAIPFLPVCAS